MPEQDGGWTIAVLSILFAAYQGIKGMLDLLERYYQRFDEKIHFLLEGRKIIPASGTVINGRPGIPASEVPYSIQEIADRIKRKETSVQKSITRLRRRGLVEPYKGGWRFKG